MGKSGDIMFIGQYQYNIDEKGRLVIPYTLRKGLGSEIIVNKGIEDCITIYTLDHWNALVDKISLLPFNRSDNRQFTRYFMSSAFQKELDGQGRINLDQILLNHAKITKECVIIGCGKTIEIWSKEKWEEVEAGRNRLEEISESIDF